MVSRRERRIENTMVRGKEGCRRIGSDEPRTRICRVPIDPLEWIDVMGED